MKEITSKKIPNNNSYINSNNADSRHSRSRSSSESSSSSSSVEVGIQQEGGDSTVKKTLEEEEEVGESP